MKDFEKTNVERENSGKRMRRRKRMNSLYVFVVLVLVLTVGITVSYTFLFNISEIRVAGESSEYSAEQIVEASGISEGDNLLRLNTRASEQKILDGLLYVETADVDRDFPSSLVITVSKCIPAFNVVHDTGTLLISRKGKILADNGFITEGLPIIYGYDPKDITPGKPLTSKNEYKESSFITFMEQLNAAEDGHILSIDMSDEYEININYSNGIIFKMGNWTDIEYKMNLAEEVMNKDGVKGKKGYITMIGSNQCGFRTSDKPAYIPGSDDQTETQPITDENGDNISLPEGEYNSEHEELFQEHNQQATQSTTEQSENTEY